jgi:hypothetical protein
VTPPGGQTTYCTQAELDLLKVASNIEHLWFGGSTAATSGDACNYDVSEVRWWKER